MVLPNDIKYNLIGYFNTSKIKNKILLNNLDWNSYKFRQKRYKDHLETKTIPIIWSENFSTPINWDPYYDIFKDDLKDVESIIKKSLCNKGNFMSAILINLPSGKSIKRHRDANPIGEKFNRCHRIHIPILTNKDCFFEIDGEIKNMREGEIWEINNIRKFHSVQNNGISDRIHLLIDWDPFL